jgi:hypothetical protein
VANECKARSLDIPICHLAPRSPIPLTAPRPSQIGIAVPDDNLESYQFPCHRLELPNVLLQDSIAALESVDPRTVLIQRMEAGKGIDYGKANPR